MRWYIATRNGSGGAVRIRPSQAGTLRRKGYTVTPTSSPHRR